MNKIVLGVIVFHTACAVWFFITALWAPFGWEDRRGFHLGRPGRRQRWQEPRLRPEMLRHILRRMA
jgi:hypothetical protein